MFDLRFGTSQRSLVARLGGNYNAVEIAMQSDLVSLLTSRKSRVPFSDSVQLQRLQELPKLGSLRPQQRSDEV